MEGCAQQVGAFLRTEYRPCATVLGPCLIACALAGDCPPVAMHVHVAGKATELGQGPRIWQLQVELKAMFECSGD
jgi:hypothetical protein